MRRFRGVLAVAAVLACLVPGAASAQNFWLGLGGTFPLGEYGDADQTAAETGWLAITGVSVALGDAGLSAGVEGFYGQNNHADGNEKTNPYGAMAILMYNTADPEDVGFYFGGGGGLLVHKFTSDDAPSTNSSDTNFGYQAFAGIGVPLGGSVGLFGEARFMGATETTFFGAMAGISVGAG